MPISKIYVDCPDCKGPGRAEVLTDRATGARLQIGCQDCGLDEMYPEGGQMDTASNQSAVAPANTRSWPEHIGAGWYRLSNGQKVRGGPDARKMQAALA